MQLGQAGERRVERVLDEVEKALQRGDTEAARQALQQARRAMDPDVPPADLAAI